jgi:hypothetical protein
MSQINAPHLHILKEIGIRMDPTGSPHIHERIHLIQPSHLHETGRYRLIPYMTIPGSITNDTCAN